MSDLALFGAIIGLIVLIFLTLRAMPVWNDTLKTYTIAGQCIDTQSQFANFRNLLDGGDFSMNPFQRGTAQGSNITNTTTYGPDRWAFKGGGAGSAIQWSQTADTNVPGFNNSLTFQRASGNTDVNALTMVQCLETADSVRLQGQQIVFSLWMRSGANYSGGAVTIQVISGQGTNQSATSMIAGTWTSQANIINTTQALTSTMTRYTFTGTVPAATTQVGVLLQWTPTGTAGANDTIILNGLQLEIGGAASQFEHRDIEVELALCQRYYFRATEVNGAMFATGIPTAVNTQAYSIWLPTPMRAAPTVTWTVGGFKLTIDGVSGTTPTTPAAGTAHSLTIIQLTTANTLTAAAHAIGLFGTGTTGFIDASADL